MQNFLLLEPLKRAMSNRNSLLSQKRHYLNQSHALNDILMMAAHLMVYFDLILRKLNLF